MRRADRRFAHKGRGAVTNPAGRFDSTRLEPADDSWGSLDEPVPSPATLLIAEFPRTAIVRNASPDVPFGQSLNPYQGCEHGCIYPRRFFTAEFKHEAVKLVRERGMTVAQAARDLGLHENVLRKWVRDAKANGVAAFPGRGKQRPDDAEVARLKRELAKTQAERDILNFFVRP